LTRTRRATTPLTRPRSKPRSGSRYAKSTPAGGTAGAVRACSACVLGWAVDGAHGGAPLRHEGRVLGIRTCPHGGAPYAHAADDSLMGLAWQCPPACWGRTACAVPVAAGAAAWLGACTHYSAQPQQRGGLLLYCIACQSASQLPVSVDASSSMRPRQRRTSPASAFTAASSAASAASSYPSPSSLPGHARGA